MYIDSVFQYFESFHKTEIDLAEDDIKLVLDEYKSSFITYELETGIYTIEEISKVLFNVLHLEYPSSNSKNATELDDITRKTK